jgi:hypothetical protein
MLGLTNGELFVVVFIVVAVVSAPYWQKAGGAIAVALAGRARGARGARGKSRESDPG